MTDTNGTTKHNETKSKIVFGAEDIFQVEPGRNGIEYDPMLTAIRRAKAILIMMSCQFEDEDGTRVSFSVNDELKPSLKQSG